MSAYSYRMPAEWEPHAATWLAWPHNERTWGGRVRDTWPAYARIAAELSRGERVEILVRDDLLGGEARRYLAQADASMERIRFHTIPTNDAWMRDIGPTFVEETYRNPDAPDAEPVRRQMMLDWMFNAWGGKYPPWDDDNAVPLRIAAAHDWPIVQTGMVLEGGAIDTNGAGCLLTTEAVLLNPNRNPSMTRAEIEAALRRWFGVAKILWLGGGIEGDDTDGHVDDLARFVAVDTVVAAAEGDPDAPNYEALAENLDRMRGATGADGAPLRIVELPMPSAVQDSGSPLPASYANFYLGNEAALVPIFNDINDGIALEIFTGLWPDRRIIGIDCREIVRGRGAIHCLTQQQPTSPGGFST